MAPEFYPSSGMYTSEQLAQMRAEAVARAKARLTADQAQAQPQTAAPEVPRPPVRRPVYGTPTPSASAQREVPPTVAPTSGPVRVARSSRPVSAPTPAVRYSEPEILPPVSKSLERIGEKRKVRPATKLLVGLGVAGAALYGANSANLLGAENLTGVTQAGFIGGGDTTAESKYGEIQLPTVARAEGLNTANCKEPGAAIATIRVTGNYALRYQLQTPDSTVAVPRPYMLDGNLSEGEGADPAHKKFETKSGYPEMTIHDLPFEIYACEKPNVAAVTQSNGVDTINASNIEFSVKPVLPAEQDNKVQTEAYMSSLGPATMYTWPSQTFLTANAERYTDESVQAAATAHAGADQQFGVFNTAIKTIVASASNADVNSAFNQSVTFAQSNVDNIYEAMKAGLEIRLGSDRVEWNGTISGLSPIVNDKNPTLIDTSAAPQDSFNVVEGEVIVGYYAPESEDKE